MSKGERLNTVDRIEMLDTIRSSLVQPTPVGAVRIVITTPAIPPKAASPNWRGHWSDRYKAMKAYKQLTYFMAKDSMRGRTWKPLSKAIIRTTLVVRDKRYIKDGDNVIASLKAGIDGIVESGILSDDKYIEMMPVRYEIDRERAPETIMEVEAIRTRRRTPPHTTQPQTP